MPKPGQLPSEVARLRADPGALAAMQAAAAALARPGAAADIADLLAGLVGEASQDGPLARIQRA
ncbi:MAG TPA: hypothetical protein VNL71_09215 [Chloroflexota bacterium]|nr:hypothetical protein [Chloroflexota bacterium]